MYYDANGNPQRPLINGSGVGGQPDIAITESPTWQIVTQSPREE